MSDFHDKLRGAASGAHGLGSRSSTLVRKVANHLDTYGGGPIGARRTCGSAPADAL